VARAEVEAYKLANDSNVKELMEQCVAESGDKFVTWVNYIKLMRAFPDHETKLRAIFKQGIHRCKEGK